MVVLFLEIGDGAAGFDEAAACVLDEWGGVGDDDVDGALFRLLAASTCAQSRSHSGASETNTTVFWQASSTGQTYSLCCSRSSSTVSILPNLTSIDTVHLADVPGWRCA